MFDALGRADIAEFDRGDHSRHFLLRNHTYEGSVSFNNLTSNVIFRSKWPKKTIFDQRLVFASSDQADIAEFNWWDNFEHFLFSNYACKECVSFNNLTLNVIFSPEMWFSSNNLCLPILSMQFTTVHRLFILIQRGPQKSSLL